MNQNPASHSNGPEPRPQLPQAPKLLDRLRLVMQQERFDTATIKRFVEWNRRFIIYHRLRHPQSLADEEIDAFVKQGSLRDADRQEAARAVRLMYRKVLGRELPPVLSAASARGASVRPTASTAATAQGEPRLVERVRQVLRGRRTIFSGRGITRPPRLPPPWFPNSSLGTRAGEVSRLFPVHSRELNGFRQSSANDLTQPEGLVA